MTSSDNIPSAAKALFYGVLVNAVTSVLVLVGGLMGVSFQKLARVMYLPSVLALVFVDDIPAFLRQVFACHSDQIRANVLYSILAVVLVYTMVYSCLVLDLATGWAKWNPNPSQTKRPLNVTTLTRLFFGFLRAAGEEIGWRCYLLPALMAHYSPAIALTISGAVWGGFHVAIMMLMCARLHPDRPKLTILVQCISVGTMAFSHGWIASKTNYSVWPSAVMHFWWNVVNPIILGSIYTQKSGKLLGPQWLINGEGVSGIIISIPLAVLAVYDLNQY